MSAGDVAEVRIRRLNPPEGADLPTWHALHQTVLTIVRETATLIEACEIEARTSERRRVGAMLEAVDLYGWEAVKDALAAIGGHL